jgi:type I restriction enzyme S subunit
MKGTKGSKMPRGDKNQIMRFPISQLSLDQEKKIGKLITDLEDKININRAINRNLEAMAKQLYDYWFVQFDFPDENGKPYKSSGGKMVWNEKLKLNIPMGWTIARLIGIADIKNGATPSTTIEENYGGDIIWITPKDLSDQNSKFVYDSQRKITQHGFDSCSTNMLPINAILLSSRAPIGLISIAKCELCTNQGFKNIVPHNLKDSSFLYYYIKEHIKQIEQFGTGTTFKEVSREDLSPFPILVVRNEVIYNKWIEASKTIFDEQLCVFKENETLSKQRDELLPLLMNGQVSINCDL